MPLESHTQEARSLLAAALISMLDAPQHWYAPMLPANHPSSFCQLLGLTEEELHHVMESSQFIVKWGKNGNVLFKGDAFHSFLGCYPELQLIDSSLSWPSAIIPRRRHWSYLIGKPTGDSRVQSFCCQLNANEPIPFPITLLLSYYMISNHHSCSCIGQ